LYFKTSGNNTTASHHTDADNLATNNFVKKQQKVNIHGACMLCDNQNKQVTK